jgi:hypothetical protein
MKFAVKSSPKKSLMENLKLVELPRLIDLLAEETTLYMRMVTTGGTKEEFERCQVTMKTIQQEIETRKSKASANAKDQQDAL